MFKGDYFEGGSKETICKEFDIQPQVLDGCEILYANYSSGCYEGSALVVLKKEGKLYEVNGSHCSCFGLENQWEPELTTKAALLARPSFYMSDYEGNVHDDLVEALKNEKDDENV
jgi:hypothetical protein